MRKFRTALAVAIFGGALALTGVAHATAPNPEHKVTICHATPADSLSGPWIAITVDVASVGYQHSGHQDEHDGDIIPPYSYTATDGTVFTYAGKGDQSILENGCVALDSSPTPTTPPPTTPPPTTPPPTTPPPTSPPSHHATHTPTWTPTWTPTNGATPGQHPLAMTGSNAGKLAGLAGVLSALGLTALYVARRRSA